MVAEWTGRPQAQHRDQDVYRFAIAQRVASESLSRRRGQPQVRRSGKTEIMTASAKRDGAAALLSMIAAGGKR